MVGLHLYIFTKYKNYLEPAKLNLCIQKYTDCLHHSHQLLNSFFQFDSQQPTCKKKQPKTRYTNHTFHINLMIKIKIKTIFQNCKYSLTIHLKLQFWRPCLGERGWTSTDLLLLLLSSLKSLSSSQLLLILLSLLSSLQLLLLLLLLFKK